MEDQKAHSSTAEDLTKEFKNVSMNGEHESGDTNTTAQDSPAKDTPNKCDSEQSEPDESPDKSEEESDGENVVTDEEYLRELESELSEDAKLERKEEAQKLKEQGNDEFKQKNFKEAVHTYSKALHICPIAFAKERSVLYSNRAAARIKLEQNEEAIKDCTKALDLNPNYVKAQLRRAQLYKATEKLDEALADYQRVLELDPNVLEARQACMTLPEEIKERNEKLKAEMMDKLKDLGNMILRPFGLSTDNFKVVQDPSSGGYSVSFQQNPTK